MDWHYLTNLILSNKSQTIGTWLAATGAVAAWVTLFLEVRRRQAERRIQMRSEYDQLFADREVFWTELRNAYNYFRPPMSPDNLENLIKSASIPPGLGKIDLVDWPQKYGTRLGPDQRIMWNFANRVYPPRADRKGKVTDYSIITEIKGDAINFHDSRAKLAKFWDKWPHVVSFRSIRKNYKSASEQWILLSWLEIALQQWTRDPGKGKECLFKLLGKDGKSF